MNRLLSTPRFISAMTLLLMLGCAWHKSDTVKPATVTDTSPTGCDTIHVSYSQSIVPILQDNCYSCHSTALTDSTGGLNLEKYTSLKQYLNYYYHNDSIYGSKFIHIIKQTIGVIPMPPSGKLSDCDIAKVNSWLNDGAPSN